MFIKSKIFITPSYQYPKQDYPVWNFMNLISLRTRATRSTGRSSLTWSTQTARPPPSLSSSSPRGCSRWLSSIMIYIYIALIYNDITILIYNMIIYYRWPSRASTRSPTTSPTIFSRSRPSFRDQRLRLMYKKKGRCFRKPFDAKLLWPVWQRIPQANDNQTSSKRPLQYRSPPHTATRNQILQNTKRTKKNREKLDKTMFDENIQFLLLTCCTTYCWKNRAPGATISSLVKFKGFI